MKINRFSKPPLFILYLLLPLACLCQGTVNIDNPRINLPLPGTSVTAGYFEIVNNTNEPVVLTGVSSTAFGKIEMHRSIVRDGIAKMEQHESITVPANSKLAFAKGDYHLMLFNPGQDLARDDSINLVFTFADGTTMDVMARVQEMNMDGEDHHQH